MTGLRIHVEKTKEMRLGNSGNEEIYINYNKVEKVEELCYFGNILTRKAAQKQVLGTEKQKQIKHLEL